MMEKKYKLGYCSITGQFFDKSIYMEMKTCSELCERFVIGIPDKYVWKRLYGRGKYSAEELKQVWLDCKWISDVIILDTARLFKQNIYQELKFDVCFYGSEYGTAYEEDRKFMEENGIDFLPLIPEQIQPIQNDDALELALRNVRPDQKIILFGTGEYFDYYMKTYGTKYAPAYAVDFAEEKRNTNKDGVLIKPLSSLKAESPKDVFIVICSEEYRSMPEQIRQIGNYDYRTLFRWHETALLDEFALAWRAEQEYIAIAQNYLDKLMREFDRVCTKYNLRYYLICGNLIGALRHQGFIPWDDDLDVAMTREDYEKLEKIAPKEWNTDEFLFLNYDELGKGLFLDFTPRLYYLKGQKVYTNLLEKAGEKVRADIKYRAFLDIAILDNASDNDKRHMFYINMMKMVYGLCMGYRGKMDYSEYVHRLSTRRMFILKTAHKIGRCLPLKMLFALFQRLTQYAAREECENYCIYNNPILYIDRKFKKAYFGDGVRKKFNDYEVMVPTDYDGLLPAMGYRQYMKFPAMRRRKPSHYFNTDIRVY